MKLPPTSSRFLRNALRWPAAGAALAAAACSSGGGGAGSDGPRTTFGGDRPVELRVPAAYDDAQRWPLLVVLHGYGVNASVQVGYWNADALVDGQGVFLLAPEGTENTNGDQFWNATDACCGFGSNVDDVAYLRALVEDVSEDYAIDPGRVFVAGHSNGGFMAHRMACDAADVVAAAVSLAGATWSDTADCAPSQPLSLLQVHGDLDEDILYAGGDILGVAYPGPVESVTHWQQYAGCTAGLSLDAARKDLDASLPGDETRVERFACGGSLDVELWTIEGGGHIPNFSDFAGAFWEWLAAHPR